MTAPDDKPRRGRSFRLVGGIFFGSIALGITFAVVVYLTMLRHVPVAVFHLPADSTSALRVDLEKVVLYEPFRKHLLPLVNELGRGSGSPAQTRLARIQAATKLDLALDLREIAAARGPGPADWVVVVGGKFPKTGIVAGVGEALREEGLDARLAADQKSLLLPGGAALGQADDGALILASSPERLASALPPQQTWQALGLTLETAASVSIEGRPLSRLSALRDLGEVERVTGTLTLDDPLRGEARLSLAPGSEPARAAERVSRALGALSTLVRLTGSDRAGEARVLETAEVAPLGPGAVRVGFLWRRDDLDRGAKSLADAFAAGR